MPERQSLGLLVLSLKISGKSVRQSFQLHPHPQNNLKADPKKSAFFLCLESSKPGTTPGFFIGSGIPERISKQRRMSMMQFIVISYSESGPLVEEFETKTKAVDFAEAVVWRGYALDHTHENFRDSRSLARTRRLRRSPRHRLPRNTPPRLVSRLAPHLPRIPGQETGLGRRSRLQ